MAHSPEWNCPAVIYWAHGDTGLAWHYADASIKRNPESMTLFIDIPQSLDELEVFWKMGEDAYTDGKSVFAPPNYRKLNNVPADKSAVKEDSFFNARILTCDEVRAIKTKKREFECNHKLTI